MNRVIVDLFATSFNTKYGTNGVEIICNGEFITINSYPGAALWHEFADWLESLVGTALSLKEISRNAIINQRSDLSNTELCETLSTILPHKLLKYFAFDKECFD